MLDVRASSETIMREPGSVSKIISITMQYWNLNIPWQKDRSLQVDFPIAKKNLSKNLWYGGDVH